MKTNRKFYLGVVLPSVLAMVLFIASIHAFFIPFFEKAILEDKKEMIAELTNTAWSLLQEFDNEYKDSQISLQEAQQLAKEKVAQIRYGSEQKDYFWIIDQEPNMIMHPYRPELVGEDLNNYLDANGKKLFVEATLVVEASDEGLVDYMWQWKDDSTKIVKKLSYVKSFKPWGWIIGTGIYIDDVQEEIRELKNSLLVITLIIAIIIGSILFYVVRQSLSIELKRQKLTEELNKSKQKYKTLVEASDEGTLMFLNQSLIFSNSKFRALGGFDQKDILNKKLEDIFTTTWNEIQPKFTDKIKSINIESSLICSGNIVKEVVLLISKVDYANSQGYIVRTKEVSGKIIAEREWDKFSGEVRTSLMLMKQPIKHLIHNIESCSAENTIEEVANKMARLRHDFLLVKQDKTILGAVTSKDISERAVAENLDLRKPIVGIMTAPLCTISDTALLHEAVLKFASKKVSHLVTLDSEDSISGLLSRQSIISVQHNTLSYILHQIEKSSSVDELKEIHIKVPSLVHALAESSEDIHDTVAFASTVSDKITRKLFEFAVEKYGAAPCQFVFIALGSEGRREQTLLTDQDNAIIYEDGKTNENVEEYFLELANYISDSLNDIGYSYCKGGVMACNSKWCQPLSMWKEYFSSWMTNYNIESLIEASTFLDFRAVHGDFDLATELKEYVIPLCHSNTDFLFKLGEMTANFKSPINAFGNLVGNDLSAKDKTIDIKTILTPIVKYARILALKHGIEETNTYERIKSLYKANILADDFYKDIYLSYNYLMRIRLKNQSELIHSGKKPSNTIAIKELSSIEKSFLKNIFSLINGISSKLTSEIEVNE